MKGRVRAFWSGMGALVAVGGLALAAASQRSALSPAAAPPSPTPAAAAPAPPKLALLKPAPAGASTFPWFPDYLRVLERFPLYHAQQWHEVESNGEKLGYFGVGDRAGAVTQARALLAIVYLAADPGYDPRPSGIAAATLRTEALGSLRDLLRTHVTGDLDRVGGGRWGGDSAAGLVVGPLVEASRLMRGQLAAPDSAAVERVVGYEADLLLKPPPASGRPRESRAAEHAAGAECLAWAGALLPKHPNAPRWEDRARWLAMNSLSAPQDRASETMMDSRRERDWVETENLLPDYLLESGGAVDPDTELDALASLSDGYYAYAAGGRSVPQALTHHFEDAWNAVRRFWLGGHRFAHPAGRSALPGEEKDVALFPVAALLEWVGSEPSVARRIERNCFQALEAEQRARGDGSFSGADPNNEAAVAAALALAALIHRQHGAIVAPAEPESLRRQLAGAWTSPAAALAVARSRNCFASWAWRSVGRPTAPVGVFVPLEAEGLAAWGPDQLVGSFDLEGFAAGRTLHHQERTIEGGFTATGQIDEGVKEGRSGLRHFVAYAALPAQRIGVLFDLAVAAQTVTVTRSEGLCLRLPLGETGGRPHNLHSEEGSVPLTLPETSPTPTDRSIASSWLNVDDQLGIAALYSQEPFTLRNAPNPGTPAGSAPVALLDNPMASHPAAYQPGQIVRDTVMLLVAGDTATTTRLSRAGAVLPTGSELVRAALVLGADGNRYLVAANFGLKETTVTLRPPAAAPLADLRLAPLDTAVLALER